jgi:hypothetical protein
MMPTMRDETRDELPDGVVPEYEHEPIDVTGFQPDGRRNGAVAGRGFETT